jgi:hypothetical protein
MSYLVVSTPCDIDRFEVVQGRVGDVGATLEIQGVERFAPRERGTGR